MITIQPVNDFADFYKAFEAEVVDHIKYCEPAREKDFGIEVDVESFQQMIDVGVLGWFVFFDEEDNFVGYAGVLVVPYLLKQGVESANIDYLYISPEYRNNGYCKEALSVLEELLKEEGIKVLNLSLPNKEESETIADKFGYIKTSSVFYKSIEEVSE